MKIDAKRLHSGLRYVLKAISTSSYFVMSNFMIKMSGGVLDVSGTDGDQYFKWSCDVDYEDEWMAVVGAIPFTNLIREYEGEVDINVKKNTIIVKKKGSTHKIKMSEELEFPLYPVLPTGNGMDINGVELAHNLSRVVYATCDNDSRPVLRCVNINAEGGITRFAALDGYVVSVVESSSSLVAEVTLSKEFALSLVQVLKDFDEDVRLLVDDKRVYVVCSDLIMIGHLFTGKYVDYARVIPEKFTFEAEIDVKAFKKALRRVSLWIEKTSFTKAVTLNFSPDNVELKQSSQDVADAVEAMAVSCEGEHTVSLSSVYLKKIFGHFDGVIKFQHNAPGLGPVIISQGDNLVALMPLDMNAK